jgi:phage gp46-like protein
MADIQIAFDNNTGVGDWVIANGDVQIADSDLVSSVLLMLFTDAVSSDDYTPGDGDRRGWWGNTFEPYEIGSRLWQLDRQKFSAVTSPLLLARDYTRTALQPFIDQGIASSITVDVAKLSLSAIQISIAMYRPNQPYPTTFNFAYAWNQLGL